MSIRYKTNVKNLSDNCIENLLKLRPIEFQCKSNGKQCIGFIAEEVDVFLPELVIRDAATNIIESVDYQYLVAPLLKLVQKQQKTIDELVLKVDTLISSKNSTLFFS